MVVRHLLLVLLSMILLFVSVGMTRGDRAVTIGPENWIKEGVGWLEGLFYQPTSTVLAFFAPIKKSSRHNDSSESSQLKAQIYQLKKENEELKKLVGYQKKNQLTYILAQVVLRSPDRWNNRVTINRGLADGVLPKMPIITAEGLIGRVQSVTRHMADIQLLTDTGEGPGIAAVIQEEKNETLGIIEGYDLSKRRLIMKKILANAQPQRGQIVVTSRLSDYYTGDVLIGTVDEVKTGEFGVDQMVYVKPAASFEQLNLVMVIRDPSKLQLKQHKEQLLQSGLGGD